MHTQANAEFNILKLLIAVPGGNQSQSWSLSLATTPTVRRVAASCSLAVALLLVLGGTSLEGKSQFFTQFIAAFMILYEGIGISRIEGNMSDERGRLVTARKRAGMGLLGHLRLNMASYRRWFSFKKSRAGSIFMFEYLEVRCLRWRNNTRRALET